MLNKLTLSAVLAAVLATTASAAFAASNSTRHGTNGGAYATVPARPAQSGAEWFQNKGNAEDMGYPYR